MITVTLGTIPFQFDRAITWLGILLDRQIITEPVFLQYGSSDISAIAQHPLVTALPVVQSEYLKAQVDASRLVIAHAGQGSTRMLVERSASFIILPRLALHREHIDNHQLMFARGMSNFGIRCCITLDEVVEAVLQPPAPCAVDLFDGPKLAEYLRRCYTPSRIQVQRLLLSRR
ncbi:MAG: glycosyl transferase [Synechococcales cyanobacterium RU_4_20]|nr:glycosyl transferase [Synechococcales cyanobacterium RU_4_20]NJR68254.1 glycosyl transferase [Synechococcales cyanobacterium CRU_2_2]